MLPLPDWLALATWLFLWLGYQWFALEPRFGRESLTTVMVPIRRKWMLEALHRENRISDASLIGNLMNSATFFSSTTLLILGGLFAFISSIDKNAAFVSNLPFAAATSLRSLEFKFVVLAFVFIYALFRFLWSIRQFNLLTILLGAFPAAPPAAVHAERAQIDAAMLDLPFPPRARPSSPPDPPTSSRPGLPPSPADPSPSSPLPAFSSPSSLPALSSPSSLPDFSSPPPLLRIVEQATRLNALAGNNFTQALRAYYYAVPILLWLINPWLLLASSLVVTTAVYFTEYRSHTAQALGASTRQAVAQQSPGSET